MSNLQPPQGTEQDAVFLREYGNLHSRLECAQQQHSVKSVAKKPQLFLKDSKGRTPYSMMMSQYEISSAEMKKTRNEIKDRLAIQAARDYYALSDELLETASNRYPQVRTKRKQFAVKMFASEAIHYGIFLIILTWMAFLSTNQTNDQAFYFNKVIRGLHFEIPQRCFCVEVPPFFWLSWNRGVCGWKICAYVGEALGRYCDCIGYL
jgi:hypothetical protein